MVLFSTGKQGCQLYPKFCAKVPKDKTYLKFTSMRGGWNGAARHHWQPSPLPARGYTDTIQSVLMTATKYTASLLITPGFVIHLYICRGRFILILTKNFRSWWLAFLWLCAVEKNIHNYKTFGDISCLCDSILVTLVTCDPGTLVHNWRCPRPRQQASNTHTDYCTRQGSPSITLLHTITH